MKKTTVKSYEEALSILRSTWVSIEYACRTLNKTQDHVKGLVSSGYLLGGYFGEVLFIFGPSLDEAKVRSVKAKMDAWGIKPEFAVEKSEK